MSGFKIRRAVANNFYYGIRHVVEHLWTMRLIDAQDVLDVEVTRDNVEYNEMKYAIGDTVATIGCGKGDGYFESSEERRVLVKLYWRQAEESSKVLEVILDTQNDRLVTTLAHAVDLVMEYFLLGKDMSEITAARDARAAWHTWKQKLELDHSSK